jgi:hypothetical protein
MAESKNNIITHGLSGKIGDLTVFSQRDGKTYRSGSNRPICQYDRNDPDALKPEPSVAYTMRIPTLYR